MRVDKSQIVSYDQASPGTAVVKCERIDEILRGEAPRFYSWGLSSGRYCFRRTIAAKQADTYKITGVLADEWSGDPLLWAELPSVFSGKGAPPRITMGKDGMPRASYDILPKRVVRLPECKCKRALNSMMSEDERFSLWANLASGVGIDPFRAVTVRDHIRSSYGLEVQSMVRSRRRGTRQKRLSWKPTLRMHRFNTKTSREQRRFIRMRVKRPGKTSDWVYAEIIFQSDPETGEYTLRPRILNCEPVPVRPWRREEVVDTSYTVALSPELWDVNNGNKPVLTPGMWKMIHRVNHPLFENTLAETTIAIDADPEPVNPNLPYSCIVEDPSVFKTGDIFTLEGVIYGLAGRMNVTACVVVRGSADAANAIDAIPINNYSESDEPYYMPAVGKGTRLAVVSHDGVLMRDLPANKAQWLRSAIDGMVENGGKSPLTFTLDEKAPAGE